MDVQCGEVQQGKPGLGVMLVAAGDIPSIWHTPMTTGGE